MISDARTNSLRFAWVIPGVLAGCRRPDTEADYRLLQSEGVGTLVSLLEVGGLPHFAHKYGFSHRHIPILDGQPPKLAQLEEFIDIVRANGPACVHCLAGIGRTGCMLVGYLVRARGLHPSEAIRQVERSRVYGFQTSEQEDWEYALAPRILEDAIPLADLDKGQPEDSEV